jgi:hypothetical protein
VTVDDPADTRDRAVPTGPGLRTLPPYLVTGNRFGSYGFGAGLSGLLLSLAPFGHGLAWLLVLAALGLGFTGFVRYTQDGATNRDASLWGLGMGWVALLILAADAAAALHIPPEAFAAVP